MVKRNEDEDWKVLANDIKECSGKGYDWNDIKNPEFCYKELARLGFSLSVTFLPTWHFEDHRKKAGVPLTDEEREKLGDGKWSYQLEGGKYKDRGNHACPLTNSLEQAASIELYNVCRLQYEGKL